LTARACRLGALDYKTITNLDPDSIIKEYVILYDIERELVASQFHSAAGICASLGTPKAAEIAKEFLDSALRVETPWSVAKEPTKTREQRLMELYNKVIKDKGTKNGNSTVVVI
jgi:hypothetical protein